MIRTIPASHTPPCLSSRMMNTTTVSRHLAGFTLLEVLLAAGLSLVMMVAVYGALDLYWKYTSAGNDRSERWQLIRSLSDLIARDIRGIAFHPQEDSTETDVDSLDLFAVPGSPAIPPPYPTCGIDPEPNNNLGCNPNGCP